MFSVHRFDSERSEHKHETFDANDVNGTVISDCVSPLLDGCLCIYLVLYACVHACVQSSKVS